METIAPTHGGNYSAIGIHIAPSKMTSAAMFQPVDTHDSFDDLDMGHASCGSDSAIEREAAAHHDGDDDDDEEERLESCNSSLPLLAADGDEEERDFRASSSALPPNSKKTAALFLFCASVLIAFAARAMRDGETTITMTESESSSKAVHVVYSSDDESLAGVEASIKSAVDHASGPVVFHYVGNTPLPPIPGADVHFKDLSRVARKYHLEDYMNPTFERGHGMTGINTNPANFVRFTIHDFLPSQSKAVWIDADTLINCDVVSLVNSVLNDEDNVIAAVPREGPLHGLTKEGDRQYADITMSFNAGFYVINLVNWRKQHISEKVREVALQNRETLIYKNGSQPPMAIAIGERFEHLPPTWNVAMSDVEEVTDQWLRETCMLHWNGPFKPWDAGAKKQYYLDLWLRYGTQVERPHHEHSHHEHERDREHEDEDEG